MIEKNPPEDLPLAAYREDDVEAERSRFPFKLLGLGLFLAVLAALIYMRWPGCGTEPVPSGTDAVPAPVRVPMDEDRFLQSMTGADAEPMRLKPRVREGSAREPDERVGRTEARLALLEERVEKLNEKLELLLLVLGGEEDGSPEVPTGSPISPGPPVQAPPPSQLKEMDPVKPPAPLVELPEAPSSRIAERAVEKGKTGEKTGDEPAIEKVHTREETSRYHVVEPGENLYRIGLKYSLNVDELMKMNGLSQGSSIRPGQRLRVSNP